MALVKAIIVLAKCPDHRKTFGMRTQQMSDGDWWRTWAFPIDEKRAAREGYGCESIHGNLYATDEYPGCPYCGAISFVQCHKCHRFSCWDGRELFNCPWCGATGRTVTATQRFEATGGDI